ncbi:retinoblastoma-associated protein-like isoform X2 [Oculina patagonica]
MILVVYSAGSKRTLAWMRTGRQKLYRFIDDISLSLRLKSLQMETKESFDQFCQQLELEEESREKAWNVWESVSTKIVETTKSALIPWFICAIFVTNYNKKCNGTQDGETFTTHSMSKLLKAARIRMVDFFQKMKVFITICDVGIPVTENLTELKKTFCVSSALFYKFKRLMPVVFKDHQAFGESEETQETFCKTCWLLFIVCKGWHPHQVTDLVTAFDLLLCCVDYVHRRFSQQQQSTGRSETNGNLEHGILSDLCQKSNVPYSKVNAVYTEYFQQFLESCSEKNTRDLVNVDDLNSMYEEIYDKSRDVDERDFFDKDGYLWIPFSETDSTATLNGGAANTAVHDECHTTTNTTTTTTSIPESRGSYLTGQSSFTDLRATLEEASHMPSQELIRFWNCCQRNPQNLIQSQLTAVQDSFIKGFNDAAVTQDSNTSIQIFVLAKKLYYRVMEAMLLAEEKRLSCSDFSALLNSSAFHVSLMACSLEVVMADKGLPWPTLAFPWILSILRLEAFDFFKVIESFILHEPLLGSNLIKHLNRIEEQVLESLAWTTGSPLLKAMETSYPHSDPVAISGQQRKKSQPLNLFLRKVNQLAYHRLTLLCNKLDVDDVLRGHMWTCLEQSLRFHWQLMKDRHLDQMLLCAVYAISKVVGKEIQFKQIVSSYKGLPFACAQVYRGTPGKEQDSIIGFYNKVYMVAMKTNILQFAPNKNPPVSPAPKSSLRIPGKKNFYLSPLKKTPSETLTPKSRSLYSFGESPGSGDRESLSRINASMRAAVHSQPKVPQKRLRFDDCDTTEPGPVLTNGHSTDKETGSHVNGTNGSKDEQESETTEQS